jgi:hypothetical protein
MGFVQNPRATLGQGTFHRGNHACFAAVVVSGKEQSPVVDGVPWFRFHLNRDLFRTKKIRFMNYFMILRDVGLCESKNYFTASSPTSALQASSAAFASRLQSGNQVPL